MSKEGSTRRSVRIARPTHLARPVSLLALLTCLLAPAPATAAATTRIAGSAADPTDAAIALSREAFADGAAAWGVLARDDAYADALTGAVVAGTRGPVLFTASSALTPATRAELERVLPEGRTVYVMGGSAAISEAVVAALVPRWRVERVAGDTRVLTALAAARLVDARDRAGAPPAEFLVAAAFRWPDALAGGAAAVARGAGLLLLDETAAPDSAGNARVYEYLAAARGRQAWVLGGEAAVPAAHAAAVAARVAATERLAGRERSGTAAAVRARLFPPDAGATIVAGFAHAGERDDDTDAWGFALAASRRAAVLGRPLLLVLPAPAAGTWDGVTVASADVLDGRCAAPADVVGAPSVVADATLAEVERLRCAPVPAVDVAVAVRGLEVPWGVADLGDGRVLVTERAGRVRLVEDGRLAAAPVWTAPDMYARGESGMMGIVAQPDVATTGHVYVCLSQFPGPRVRVVRLRLVGSSAIAEGVVLDLGPAATNHDGCAVTITRTGLLVATMGDGGVPSAAADLGDPRGKVHRIRLDGTAVDGNAAGSAWTFGHRNPQGVAQHPVSDVVLAAEHGPNANDEVNVLHGGAGYGWPAVMGPDGAGGAVDPIWASGSSTIATAGAAVPATAAWAGLRGDLVVATLKDRTLRALPLSPDGTRATGAMSTLVGPAAGHGRLRAVAVAGDGALWVTTSNCDGRGTCPADGDRLLRVTPRG